MESISAWFGAHAVEMALTRNVFLVVFTTLLVNMLAIKIVEKIHKKAGNTKTIWDDVFVQAVNKPLGLLIWLFGFSFACGLIENISTDVYFFEVLDPVRKISVVAIFAWFLIRLIKGAEEALLQQEATSGKGVDRTTADAISKILRLSVTITAVLISLQTLNIHISGLLAVGGAGSLVVGFAAKDLLANFFGSLMVYFDRPFAVGDWVRSPDKSIEGTVEKIGWRLTRIRTFDKRPLYVPNSVFTTIAIENPSRMLNRRIKETIGLRYDDIAKVSVILADIKYMLEHHPEIDSNQTLMVNFNQFGPSSLDFFIYTFTKTTNWVKFHEVKQDVLLKISEIIANHSAEIAYPTSTLHVEPVEVVNSDGGSYV